VVLAERATMPLVDLQILVGAPMTTIQSSLLWGDRGLTSSVVLLAFLIRREGFGVREVNANLEFDDQPPYPNSQ
jgi:hypothetical protein